MTICTLLLVVAVFLNLVASNEYHNLRLGKDSSPMRFTYHLYNATINENSAPRTAVESPIKMGVVIDPLWNIKFKLVSGDDDGLFKAEEVRVGDFCILRIKTRSSISASLNREVRDSYTLTIEATEITYDFQARTKVLVQVLDTNDLKPLFYPASYNVVIREDAPLKSSVVRVSATDADIGCNAEFYYSFTTRAHPFTVDPFSGAISLVKRLNHSRAETYDVTVLAEDRTKKISGVKKFGNVARVTVTIEKVSSTGPTIKPLPVVLAQKDEEEKITIDVLVESGVKQVESVSIVGGDPQRYFEIIPSSLQVNGFQVVSTKRMNWSQSPSGFNLSLQAKDKSSPPLVSPVSEIHIPPYKQSLFSFLKDTYILTLSEFSPPKTHVIRVSVSPAHLNVTFHIKSNSDSHKFKINPKTGILVTSESFDFEKKSRYEFDIIANHGEAETHIVIDITDENDNAPTFTKPSYQTTLSENVPIGSSVLTVTAIDVDRGRNGFVTYAIANSAPSPFTIDPISGVISTSEDLDYELMKRWYHLRVWASDSGSPFSHVSECAVTITMSNVNDNTPLFEQVGCNATIPVDLAVGEPIAELSAVDLDELQQLRYVIESGNDQKLFDIDAVSGVITLIRQIPTVSIETELPLFRLRITATDGKHTSDPSVVTVTVINQSIEATVSCQETGIFKRLTDKLIESIKPVLTIQDEESFSDVHIINRHSPKFNSGIPSTIDIREDFPLNSTILHFKASDNDTGFNSKLVYAISSGNEDGCFSIGIWSGELKLVCPLDRETKEFYILNVTVYDLGSPQTSAWKFLAVNLLDVNDNRPVFNQSRYVVHIPENTEVDTTIFQMHATDLDSEDSEGNGNILYSMLTLTNLFKINELTGKVKVSGRLDREAFPRHDLKVEARDQSKKDPQLFSLTDLVVVLEDINDNPPKFVPKIYNIKVPEDFPLGTVLLWVESYDLDLGSAGQVSYNLKNSENGAFFLDASTGSLTLEKELDFEMRQSYNLTVQAVDHGLPRSLSSSCFIEVEVLDVNENLNKPVFSMFVYEASVMEDAPVGTSVFTLTAADWDQGKDGVVRYHIHDGSGLGVFMIDEETGVIRTAETLDREAVPHYWLSVYAKDLGTIPLVTWTDIFVEVLDINDNPPQMSQPVYFGSVLENMPKDKSVVQVTATDVDSSSEGKLTFQLLESPRRFPSDEFFSEVSEASPLGTPVITVSAASPSAVHYSIKDGDPNGTFHINAESGVLSVQASLNFERCFSYRLKVRASTSAGASSDTVVYVYVIDENDNPPVFLQEKFHGQISESAHINSMVMGESNTPLVIRASDADRDSNSLLVFQILEPEAMKVFKIDPSMGTLSVISEVDFEETPEFHFSIQVRDSGEPSLCAAEPARVTIRVLDINDCSPKFSRPVYESSIIFPPVREMEVVRVMAQDADSAVSYSITEGNLQDTFLIHPSTGAISVNNVSEFKSFYQLLVKASDGLYKDLATVKINVTNITAGGHLKFEQGLYAATIEENSMTVKMLAVLRASGSYLNEPLIYSVLNPMGRFAIVPTSGVLETTGVPFDREEQDVYDIVVEVRDMRSPPRWAITHISVYISDINDNPPRFLNLPHSMMISEDTDLGDVIFQVMASDRDLGENGSVIYLLEEDFDLFRIDPYVGDVSLQRPIDFEATNKYTLTVLATDEGSPSWTTSAELSITVRNRTNPIFQTLLYPLKVPENISPFTTILHVQARNPEGYRLIYNLEEKNASKNFHIDFKTGVLSVTDLLDYESQTMHLLTVRATDSVTGSFSEAAVELEVEDVNDNAPVFSKLTDTVDIPEGLPIGTSVLQISATDRDSGRNRDLTFHILGMWENETDFFKIDPQSGLIVTTQVLDYEKTKHFQLKITAIDNGTNPLSSDAYVIVNVTDVNDNPPNFSKTHYQATLDELAKCGHIVIRIQASDPDTRDLNILQYKILSGNEGRYFAINESSGIISFSNVCKRNVDPFYNLTVAVSDGVFQNTAPVNIDMMNTNKHSPYFNKNIYEAELAENAEAGTRVIRLAAIDPDDGPYGSVDYTIINKLADDKFSIDKNGQIVTSQPLDRENPSQRVIAIKVMAKDGGGKVAFCTVKIILTDENDNAPQFKASEYQVSIQSTVNKGSPVIQIMAYDADDGKNADVTYTVEEAEEVTQDIIEINPFTGIVSVKESLIGQENKILNFKVKARDGGLPFYNSTVPVQVKVVPPEVSLPKFSEPLYTFSAAEDISIGTEIGTIKADSDMPVIYSLVNGNTVESNRDRVFALDKESGTLLVQKSIDHEKTKWYQIDVIAQGNHNGTDVASLVSVSIQVQDVNDNVPVFEANPYKAFLAENMPPGTTVIQVTANDPDQDTNGQVTYTLEAKPDDVADVFSIDRESGWITTLRETDCEMTQHYSFTVVATDHGGEVKLSSSVLVEVTVTDENDNPARFTEDVYHGSVMENTRPGEVIMSLTTVDMDVTKENRQITCYITDGDPLGQFSIVQEGEEWGLVLKESLDRESKDKYSLKIIVTDGRFEAPATVEVHVLDINDNSPLCVQLLYTEVVMENSPSRMFIMKVSASDPDMGTNGLVSYTLHGPNADKFHLDQKTGELFTLAQLDREKMMEYDLVVKATDGGGRSCQADILLMIQDMNDNPPKFSNNHYEITVFDNTTVRTPIAVIYAKDPDTGINSEVKYSLLEDNSGHFSLEEFSGILRLERSLAENTRSTFELKVKATDRGLPRQLYSIATVTVHVVDLSNYKPVFLSQEYSAQIPESTLVGSEVISVSALTRDGTETESIVYSIVSGNEGGRFYLHPATGVLAVNGSLDFERCREYYLSLEGTRGKSTLSDITMVIINITDVNDNTPMFGQGDYSADASEDLSPGDVVMQVTAIDLDGPLNNLIQYSISSGDPHGQFSIDPRSGEVIVRATLDREEITHYSLTVQAADEGDPPLSTAVQVTLTVSDVNDNPPVFSQMKHNLVLQEGEAIGSSILQLVVTDRDTPHNGPPFTFHIASGNEDRRFHVDQGGLLSISAPLKKMIKPQHLLKIQVTDSGHPPLSSICVVKINVTEQSKYPPSVMPLEVFITTTGDTFSNRVIGKLHASDQDLHDILNYKLISESPGLSRFSVDLVDGKIWADEDLKPGLYSLNVSVSDGKFSVWAGVKVHVWKPTQQALDAGLTLQLAGLSPEEFLGDHWRGLQRSLSTALGITRQDLHLVSLQQQSNSLVLEALLLWRPHGGTVEPLPTNRLAGIIADIEDSLGLSVLKVHHNGCLGTECPPRGCRNSVQMRGEMLSHYATARAGFITPQHTWESVCPCNESAVSFDGNGYLKYMYQTEEEEENQNFRLSLRIKTFQQQGVVMSTNDEQCSVHLCLCVLFCCLPQLIGGELRFMYLCGNRLPGSLRVHAAPAVSDGRWHHVLLEVNSTVLRLTLDHVYSAQVVLSEPCHLMQPHGTLILAGAPGPGSSPTTTSTETQGMELNGEPIRTEEDTEWNGPGRRRVFGVYQCCVNQDRMNSCDSNPCLNGGICEEESNGGFHCSCPESFHGPRCELDSNPCASQPCAHGGVCVPKSQGYICNCQLNMAGNRYIYLSHSYPSHPCSLGINTMLVPPPPPRYIYLSHSYPSHPCSLGINTMTMVNDNVLFSSPCRSVYPADPDYYGRPNPAVQDYPQVQEFPQFDIVEDTYGSVTASIDSRRNSRYSGFPFPLERSDRRAPLPPCYSNQNLDDFLGPDGLPLPSSQCPNEYTAISYYPTQHAQSMDNVSSGYRRLSMRLSVAMPSYAECNAPPPPPATQQAGHAGRNSRCYNGSDVVGSDYGSCEEVMF
uniref:FAT atypical cadherin 2 n=1 Tax=Oncorhynchus kisutch TaxID=8019 RepID=A0A8C7FUQ2_ONCKI